MRLFSFTLATIFGGVVAVSAAKSMVDRAENGGDWHHKGNKITPKVFIIDMYNMEAESWYGIKNFNLLAHNITVPGLSPLFPDVHCTADYSICQLIAGEAEINAAVSIASLVSSSMFDLRRTYFLITGIAGVSAKMATIGSVTFARYAIQVALQYEFDVRELPANFTTGYIPLGSTSPSQYPQAIYGTEVFELNQNLRDVAMGLATHVRLNDTQEAAAYRALFATASGAFAMATKAPSIIACDTATSDVFFTGAYLEDAFNNYTKLVTNGTGTLCTSQQEDNAVLEALLRGDVANRTDFSRIIIMRTASDFISPPPNVSAFDNLIYGQAGYIPALVNIRIAGVPIVTGIVRDWGRFSKGIKPTNYIGDILGTLGGTPNFGTGLAQEPEPLVVLGGQKRDISKRQVGGRISSRYNTRKSKILPKVRLSRHD